FCRSTFTVVPEFFVWTACAAWSTYFGLTPSSSGYETVIVPVRPLAWLGAAPDDEAEGCAAGAHATTIPVAAATLRNFRREYVDIDLPPWRVRVLHASTTSEPVQENSLPR